MWSGYLENEDYRAVRERFDGVGARFEQIHTSGHASRSDLEALAAAVGARAVVPIHGLDWDQHRGTFEGLKRLPDGERHEVGGFPSC